jgi:hypothetical protein
MLLKDRCSTLVCMSWRMHCNFLWAFVILWHCIMCCDYLMLMNVSDMLLTFKFQGESDWIAVPHSSSHFICHVFSAVGPRYSPTETQPVRLLQTTESNLTAGSGNTQLIVVSTNSQVVNNTGRSITYCCAWTRQLLGFLVLYFICCYHMFHRYAAPLWCMTCSLIDLHLPQT